MKRTALLGALMLLGLAYAAWATIIPTFAPTQNIYWGGTHVIQVGYNGPIPNVADWDHDGVKDMMVGVYTAGRVYYYHNTGTNANPVFNTQELVSADGSPIALSYG